MFEKKENDRDPENSFFFEILPDDQIFFYKVATKNFGSVADAKNCQVLRWTRVRASPSNFDL